MYSFTSWSQGNTIHFVSLWYVHLLTKKTSPDVHHSLLPTPLSLIPKCKKVKVRTLIFRWEVITPQFGDLVDRDGQGHLYISQSHDQLLIMKWDNKRVHRCPTKSTCWVIHKKQYRWQGSEHHINTIHSKKQPSDPWFLLGWRRSWRFESESTTDFQVRFVLPTILSIWKSDILSLLLLFGSC